MAGWDGWDVGRLVLVLAAIMYLGIWIQLSLFHWAGAFKRWEMWGPVIATPVFALVALLGVFVREGLWGWLVAAVLAVAVVEGLAGLYYHLEGMRHQIGGFSLRNLLSGPPPMLPVAYSIVGVFGLVGLLWNA